MSDNQIRYAVFPHQEAFAVAHLGYCRVPMSDLFQTAWVLDALCPTETLAIEAMSRMDQANKARIATELADQLARARRR